MLNEILLCHALELNLAMSFFLTSFQLVHIFRFNYELNQNVSRSSNPYMWTSILLKYESGDNDYVAEESNRR